MQGHFEVSHDRHCQGAVRLILALQLISVRVICVSDSGVLRRVVYIIYTDCIRQCSGPMYIVSNDQI